MSLKINLKRTPKQVSVLLAKVYDMYTPLLQAPIFTNAELAFKNLDKDGSGFISQDELKTLSTRLSKFELDALMAKVYTL